MQNSLRSLKYHHEPISIEAGPKVQAQARALKDSVVRYNMARHDEPQPLSLTMILKARSLVDIPVLCMTACPALAGACRT